MTEAIIKSIAEMTEHTALPWHASQKSVYVSDIHHRVIAEIHRNGDERVANAAFIVKAVNSHDALVRALEFIRDGYERGDINHVDYRVGAYKAALDALALVGQQRSGS